MGFVLASASPRRKALLAGAGLHPEVEPSQVDETPRAGELPLPYALRIASAKAAASSSSDPVLAADTVVALDGDILTKAEGEAESRAMLARLSGRSHSVHTAVVLRTADGTQLSRVVSTTVRFRELSDAEIASYVDSGEPADKAGAYGIQGLGGALVAEVHGSYTNVVGLPLEETLDLLRLAGVIGS